MARKPDGKKQPQDLGIDARILKLILNPLAPNIIYTWNTHGVMFRALNVIYL
jgi:hypothetical protein